MLTLNLKKGLDLNLRGGVPDGAEPVAVNPASVAVFPSDFPGFVPKLVVREGDSVAAGQPLCVDKATGSVALVSPASGTVTEVLRAERRRIERIVVTPGAAAAPATLDLKGASSPEGLRSLMQGSGIWAMMRQLPYAVVPSADAAPRDIMVTAFDSAPLAPSLTDGTDPKAVARGLQALATLTAGKVYVAARSGSSVGLPQTANIELVEVSGAHPAGLPSVQIANIAPVNKGETVWLLDITVAARLGKLLLTGSVDFTTVVAVTGSELERPYLARTVIGADLRSLLANAGVKADGSHKRFISGNVLTGLHVDDAGWLHFPWRQVSVIPEGDDVDEFMGWASNSLNKMSQSRSFLSHFFRHRKFAPDARLNGGRRAMIMSGQYDSVFPMDVLPEYLVKAVLARDIDRMEALGIYEVAPEDLALCEFVDTSKLPVQQIVRDGLDYLRTELD